MAIVDSQHSITVLKLQLGYWQIGFIKSQNNVLCGKGSALHLQYYRLGMTVVSQIKVGTCVKAFKCY